MYYKVINNKKKRWILLIHCICSNMNIFKNEISKLSKKYNVLLIDLPGHGNSQDYEKFTFETVASEIAEILNSLKIDSFDIWGISLGAIVATYVAEIMPERIGKIIFEGPAFGFKNRIMTNAFNMFNTIKFFLPKKVYIWLFIQLTLYGKNKKKIKKCMLEYTKFVNKNSIALWLDLMNKEYLHGMDKKLSKININKIYYIGEKDYVFKSYVVKNIKNDINNSIIILKDCSHLCHLENESLANYLTSD